VLFPSGRRRATPGEARGRPLLITGATGTLGQAFGRLCAARGLAYRLTRRTQLDIADPRSVESAIDAERPWAVINAAGYVRVDDAEHDADRCMRENAVGPRVLAEACATRGLPLVVFSTDFVFDGELRHGYLEHDAPNPLNVYGRSKAQAEESVLRLHPAALVVRTSGFFGPWDEHNFVFKALNALRRGTPFHAASDQTVAPTYVPDLVHVVLDLLLDRSTGLWHLANRGSVTWEEFAREAAIGAGISTAALRGVPTEALALTAPRPRFSVLASIRSALMPGLSEALGRFLVDWAAPREAL
jgi:dTDP-4-dehydrorhamnose reductase